MIVVAVLDDAAGRLSSVTDAESNATSYQYDNQNNLTQVTDANTPAGVTTYGYDAKGNLTSVTDAKRQTVGTPETGAECGPSQFWAHIQTLLEEFPSDE